MPNKYRHIKSFEKERIEYLEQGHTLQEAGDKFGFTYKEMQNFKPKGRSRKGRTHCHHLCNLL